jgi:hypothetical protein
VRDAISRAGSAGSSTRCEWMSARDIDSRDVGVKSLDGGESDDDGG